MKKEIISTLTYADIFDYPLLALEVWKFLISQKKTRVKDVQQVLLRMSTDLKLISTDNKYFFLQGRKEVVDTRRKRRNWSQSKLKIAQKAANWLKIIPTIKMVAVTGALAMENSNENDDIDLLIITSKNRLWLTRFLTVILLELVAKRRHPTDKEVKDKICLNMFLDEGHLEVPKKEQDLFSAHEVYQLKPILDKNGTYQKFLKANLWSKKYLANWKP